MNHCTAMPRTERSDDEINGSRTSARATGGIARAETTRIGRAGRLSRWSASVLRWTSHFAGPRSGSPHRSEPASNRGGLRVQGAGSSRTAQKRREVLHGRGTNVHRSKREQRRLRRRSRCCPAAPRIAGRGRIAQAGASQPHREGADRFRHPEVAGQNAGTDQASEGARGRCSGTGRCGTGMGPNRDLHLAGKGAIRYPADVAGQVLADMLFQKFLKPAGWEQDLQQVCAVRKQSLPQGIKALENVLADSVEMAAKSHFDAIQTHYGLAQLEAYQGNMDRAIREWEQAYKLAATDVPEGIPQLDEVLGVAYLHKSELENGVYREPGDSCIFPPRGNVCYRQTSDSQRAIEYLTRYLELKRDRPDAVQVKWLLNLAYMTLGKYPEGVPQKYLISPSVFVSKENFRRFIDVAPAAGLNFFSMAGGVVADDFENDGLLDVAVSSYDVCQPLRFFHNNGDGTFTDREVHAGLSDQLGGLNMVQADYNNDGCMDILILRGAWEFPLRKSLLRNNCDGTFTDVTREAGLAEPATRTQTAAWADINNDGFLDLFVGNENGPSQLFLNKGDGTFQEISAASGVNKIAFTKGVAAADYDNDGYVDLYVSNLYGGNFLYHNNHKHNYTEGSEQAGF